MGAVCALGPASAGAAVAQFGSEGEGAGQFSEATGIAIDRESGDVVLADTANNRVEEFTGEGEFVRTWGWGVRDGSEEFQICEAPGPCRAGNPGSGEGQFAQGQASGVAIDNSAGLAQGDIYVVDRQNHRVDRFGPNGEFILSFGEAGSGPGQLEGLGVNAISVGPTGTVYVADIDRVQKFSSAGVLEGEIALPSVGSINDLLVDSEADLYVLGEGGVRKFNGKGEEEPGGVRDPGVSGSEPSLALGADDELLISDPAQGHIFGYDPEGAQTLSLVLPEASAVAGGLAYANGTLYVLYATPSSVRPAEHPPAGPGDPRRLRESRRPRSDHGRDA